MEMKRGELKKAVALRKREDFLLKKLVPLDEFIPIQPVDILQVCFVSFVFFLNTNQIQLVRLVSLFKMKMRTTIRTATFTCSRTNNQNNILQQEEKMDAHRSCFILTVLVTVDGMIKKRSNTEFQMILSFTQNSQMWYLKGISHNLCCFFNIFPIP